MIPPSTAGRLLRKLTPAERSERITDRVAASQVQINRTYRLWELDGLWSVVGPGPKTNTWWMYPVDSVATRILRQAMHHNALIEPVAIEIYVSGNRPAIAVRTDQLRNHSGVHHA